MLVHWYDGRTGSAPCWCITLLLVSGGLLLRRYPESGPVGGWPPGGPKDRKVLYFPAVLEKPDS